MTAQCLCQICTCGSVSVCLLTEYQDKFLPHGRTTTRASKKVQNEYEPLAGEMSSTTTFQSDYVPHQVTQRAPKATNATNATNAYVPPTGGMLLKSTYMCDFRTYPVHKHIADKTVECSAPKAKMDAQSVYKEDFRAWNTSRRQPYKPSDNLTVSQGEFDMTTTAQDDFCAKHGGAPRGSFKPTPQLHESLPFEGTTLYRAVYVPHAVQRRPPRQKVPYKPSSAPLLGVSTHRRDYRDLRGETAQSCKATPAWEARVTPFEDATEFQDKYRIWPVPPATKPRKAAEYSPPEGDMEFTSTARGDFVGAQSQPAKSACPPVKACRKGKPFEAHSTMKEDFRAWDGAKRGRPRRQPSGAFEGVTNFRSQYMPKMAVHTASFTPAERALSPRVDESGTVYRTSYTEKKIRPCPASFSQRPEVQHRCVGKAGHILFRPASAGATAATTSAKSSHCSLTRPVKSAVLRRGKRTH